MAWNASTEMKYVEMSEAIPTSSNTPFVCD